MRVSKEKLISAIRTAAQKAGVPPGRETFRKLTGYQHAEWQYYWPRWGDAVRAAGLKPNERSAAHDKRALLLALIPAVRKLGHVPTSGEMRVIRRSDPTFPSPDAYNRHFRSKAALETAVREIALEDQEFADVGGLCREPTELAADSHKRDGHVYLFKLGDAYKLGKSADVPRRYRQLQTQMYEDMLIVHIIRTDDENGIEKYWQDRWNDRRMKGEWFKLTRADVAAFKKRTFQ